MHVLEVKLFNGSTGTIIEINLTIVSRGNLTVFPTRSLYGSLLLSWPMTFLVYSLCFILDKFCFMFIALLQEFSETAMLHCLLRTYIIMYFLY